MRRFKIIYDENCSFCLWLGELVKKKSGSQLELMTYSELISTNAGEAFVGRKDLQQLSSIAAIDGDDVFFHEDAWNILTQHFPGISSLHWLADKIGLRRSFVGLVKNSSSGARFLCSRCRSRS